MKALHFTFRGDHYQVNEKGEIKANGLTDYAADWLFLGGTKHHWSNRIQVKTYQAFENPALLNGCLGWDMDHGTFRQWGGRYCGKLPRIQNAYTTA